MNEKIVFNLDKFDNSIIPEIKNALKNIKNAGIYINSVNKIGTNYNTNISDVIASVQEIYNIIIEMSETIHANDNFFVNALNSEFSEIIGYDRSLSLTDNDGFDIGITETSANKEQLLTENGDELLLTNDTEFIEDVLFVDAVSGKIVLNGRELKNWDEVLQCIKGKSATIDRYLQLEFVYYENENYEYFVSRVEEMSVDGITAYELAEAFAESGLIMGLPGEAIDEFTDGKKILFQQGRNYFDFLTLNSCCLQNPNNVDIQTAEALALIYLKTQRPDLFQKLDFDFNSDYAVDSFFAINLDSNSNEVNERLIEAYFYNKTQNGEYSYLNIYSKSDNSWITLSSLEQQDNDIYILLTKNYKDLTSDEINILNESPYCFGLYGNDIEMEIPYTINLGTYRSYETKWYPIVENQKLLNKAYEETDLYSLLSKTGEITSGTYFVVDIERNGDLIVAVNIGTTKNEKWVFLNEFSNISFNEENNLLTISESDKIVNTYDLNDNFLTMIYSFSSGVWYNPETGKKVSYEESNAAIKKLLAQETEEFLSYVSEWQYTLPGINYAKECGDYLNERGFTCDRINKYMDVNFESIQKKDLGYYLQVSGATMLQIPLYLTEGFGGFFENCLDGFIGFAQLVCYLPTDLFFKFFGDVDAIIDLYNKAKSNKDEMINNDYFYKKYELEDVVKTIFNGCIPPEYQFSKEFYEALRMIDYENIINSDYYYQNQNNIFHNLLNLFEEDLGGSKRFLKIINEDLTNRIVTNSMMVDEIQILCDIFYISNELTYKEDAYGNKILTEESKKILIEDINNIEYNNEILYNLFTKDLLCYDVNISSITGAPTLNTYILKKAYDKTYFDISLEYAEILDSNIVGDENFYYIDKNNTSQRYTEKVYFTMALDLINGDRKNLIRQSIINNKNVSKENASIISEYGTGVNEILKSIIN